jgi:putative ABC transport system substrate-binding protein
MKRREFITLLGGAAVAWPLAARAQQPSGIRRIGVLSGVATEADSEAQARDAVFREALQKLGWTEGRTSNTSTVSGPATMPILHAETRRN